MPKAKKHITVTAETGQQFYQEFQGKGKVVMLNLLNFKAKADYTDNENMKPENNITGAEAYKLYMKHTQPCIRKAGSKLLFSGTSNSFLIGPKSEKWDMMLLVEHASVEKLMEFEMDKEYLKTAGHRTAALEDSRLLPIAELKQSGS